MYKQIERAGDDNKNNIGVLYGIGVGPGDPELMTLKAINTIKACDKLQSLQFQKRNAMRTA